jgi:uncharacterized protein (DUF433 family)
VLGSGVVASDWRSTCAGAGSAPWIAGREGSVLLNPRIGFGVPVLGRSGVRTEEVAARIAAGETKAEIAEDLGVNEAEVIAAMRWEASRAAG